MPILLIGLLLIALKLTGTIAWSWWIVLLPFFVPVIFAVGFVLTAALQQITKDIK